MDSDDGGPCSLSANPNHPQNYACLIACKTKKRITDIIIKFSVSAAFFGIIIFKEQSNDELRILHNSNGGVPDRIGIFSATETAFRHSTEQGSKPSPRKGTAAPSLCSS